MQNLSFITTISSILLIGFGYLSPSYGEQIKTMGFYSFSGAITNWLAIHMLFEKVPFLYGSGIITNRFEEFKVGIKDLIKNQFFNNENVSKFLDTFGPKNLNAQSISSKINFDQVFEKLKAAIIESPFGSMLGMFGGAEALDPLKPNFETKFNEIIEDIFKSEQFKQVFDFDTNSFAQKIDHIIDSRLEELTPKMVKDIIQLMIKKHLGWLVVWGGIFGALIGLASTFIS